jgi:electron transfer flavoprotein alpha subunit
MSVIICLFGKSGFDRAAAGVAGAGRNIAVATNTTLQALVIGAAAPGMTEALGAVVDSISVMDAPKLNEYQIETTLSAITQGCQSLNPSVVLLANDSYSQEITARLAHRLGGSAVGDGVKIEAVDGKVHVTRSVYGGKAEAVVELKKSPAVVWLRARAFDPAPAKGGETAAVNQISVSLEPSKTKIIERKSESTGEAKLEDAQIIISGGRGLGGPEPFEDLKALAAVVGGQVAASRAACDSGWCPPTWQVGQTGKKVAPQLYLAVALSGASQHLAGMSDSKVVAAINTDKDAPIFKHCKFGIVEDYKKVIPLLKEKLAAAK